MSSPVSTQLRFLDSFDSVRKHQAPALTDGQLKLHLLLGETLRISQTQAFDSASILRYGNEAEFLQLIRYGAIEVIMQPGVANPWHAFASKVRDPAFHLSAWPEFEEIGREPTENAGKKNKPVLSRQEAIDFVEEATRKNKVPWDLPVDVYRRWRSLMEISRAVEEARTWRRAPEANSVPFTLGDRISLAAAQAKAQPHLVPHLKELALAGNSEPKRRNDRSLYHRHLDQDQYLDPALRPSLRSIIDLLYNRVIAESLQSPAELTTLMPDALEVVEKQDSIGSIRLGEPSEAHLEGLTWSVMLELREILLDQDLSVERKKSLFKERCAFTAYQLEDKSGWAFELVPVLGGAAVGVAVSHAVNFIVLGRVPGADTIPGRLILEFASNVASEGIMRSIDAFKNATARHQQHEYEQGIVALLSGQIDQEKAPQK